MKKLRNNQAVYLACAIVTIALGITIPSTANAAAPRVKLLYSFAGGDDGQYPDTEFGRDSVGNLYGTTREGGLYGYGTVFELTQTGTHRVLYNFSGGIDGGQPSRGLYADWVGNNIYGTTTTGGGGSCPSGCGVFYRLTKTDDGTFAFEVIHTFTGGADGSNPNSSLLVRGSPGAGYYGMTTSGGALGAGVAYRLEQDQSGKWHFRVLHTFTGGTDGVGNSAKFVAGHQFIIGVSPVGGLNGKGSIFELFPTAVGEWIYSTVYSFKDSPDGAFPSGGLVGFGAFYGVTSSGGAYGFGTIYEILIPENAERVIYNFRGGSDGGNPVAAPVIPTNISNPIYGATTTGGDSVCNCGTIYRLFSNAKGGWNENIAARMPGAPGLGLVYDQMLNLGGGGPFYGTSVTGGASNNGAIYEFEP